MADEAQLADYDPSDHEDDNPTEEGELTPAPNASTAEKEPAEPDPGAQSDPVYPAAKVPKWYRGILGEPESWTDAKWQVCFKSPASTSAGVEGASAEDVKQQKRLKTYSRNTWTRWERVRRWPPRRTRTGRLSGLKTSKRKEWTCGV